MPNTQRTEKAAPSADESAQSGVPPQILQNAGNAAAAATSASDESRPIIDVDPPIEDVPPPPYSAEQYGEIDINEKGMETGARVSKDGRVNIKISSKNKHLTTLLRRQLEIDEPEPAREPEPEIPAGLGYVSGLPPPPMNIVIQIVGSRGDVQPFVALGQVLKEKFNHRIRIATHPVFKDFVTENGLEFFSIGGDPAELMAFMVKNPGLMPGFEAIRSGDIGKRRKGIYEMINGCWRSCIEPGDGTGAAASDDLLETHSVDSGVSVGDADAKPFIADAIIANPPSFAHIHIAEKLGIPLHLMFTMPWSPTQSFPHPLANVVSSNADAGMTNFLSYLLVDLLTWQGIGDLINRFREKQLNLEPLSVIWAPGNLHRLRIPWTYCWSPALIPKPGDWKTNIDLSGFYFLNLATNYTPPPDLAEFLGAGPPPVYIGFGSIVVDDPNAMTKLIFEAVKKTGQRALVSKGWGGLSGDEMGVPEGVFMLGNCPHDWLFKKVSCVVHHGGAGTTAAGISAGRPTIIVPFFGDQQFWGQMCHRAGAGPEPIPHKKLTADNLAEAINFALQPETLNRAKEMSNRIKQENGCESGAESFHRHLSMAKMRCSICPGRVAVWQYKKSDIRLSALAATVLANDGQLDFSDLRLFRSREYIVETGPPEPITGGAAALIGSIGQVSAGVADYPAEIWKSFKGSNKPKESGNGSSSATAVPPSSNASSANLSTTDTLSPTPSSANIIVTSTDSKDGSERPRSASRDASQASLSTASLRPVDSRRLSQTSNTSAPEESGTSTPKAQGRAQQITMDSLVGSARATSNIVVAGMKSPLDFTMSIAQGFHNAPKLYGDKTVRPTEKVTGFHSGLKAAGKEFGYGFYDGISGLVTQPMQGAKSEGFAGFSKGLIKGSLGLVLKPGAAIWGLPGYTMKGVYAEIVKNFGKSTSNFIIAARTAQGYDDWKSSSEGERERIIATWKSEVQQGRTAGKRKATSKPNIAPGNNGRFYDDKGKLLSGFMATKHLSIDDRKELDRLKKEAKQKQKSKSKQSVDSDAVPGANNLAGLSNASDAEFEQAIRTAVQNTSNNDPEEDARIERAIRASVQEFQRKMRGSSQQPGNDEDEDEAYNRAIAASLDEYRRPLPRSTASDTDVIETTLENEGDDEAFSRALAASLEGSRRAQAQQHGQDEGLGPDTDEDEDYRKAVEASMAAANSNTIHQTATGDEDEEYKRAIEESMRHQPPPWQTQYGSSSSAVPSEPPPQYEPPTQGRGLGPEKGNTSRESKQLHVGSQQQETGTVALDDEDDMQRVLEASKQEAKQREQERTEEDIVLEYVKKQSLAEEEYRKKMQQGH